MTRVRPATVVLVLVLLGRSARGDDEPRRPPLAEPIFTETVTDIDGYEAGELELDLNGSEMVARRGGARLYQSSLEAEWKVTRQLGLRLEPTFTSSRQGLDASSEKQLGLRAAAGWSLLHDFTHDFHLQLEATARAIDDSPEVFRSQPGEAPLPYYAELKAAKRIGAWTLRGGVGAEAGGAAAHAPLRTQLSLMHPYASDIRFGFAGVEADVDFARRNPLVLAPNIWADLTPLGIPARLGVAIPFIVGAPDTYPASGVFVRLLLLTSREASFERAHSPPGPRNSTQSATVFCSACKMIEQ